MLGVTDPVSPEWLYDTDETRDDNPQFPMEHIQDPADSGRFSNGDNSSRDDVSSIVPVAYHRSVYRNSHNPYKQHSQ